MVFLTIMLINAWPFSLLWPFVGFQIALLLLLLLLTEKNTSIMHYFFFPQGVGELFQILHQTNEIYRTHLTLQGMPIKAWGLAFLVWAERQHKCVKESRIKLQTLGKLMSSNLRKH